MDEKKRRKGRKKKEKEGKSRQMAKERILQIQRQCPKKDWITASCAKCAKCAKKSRVF
jgi:hypothetical protein